MRLLFQNKWVNLANVGVLSKVACFLWCQTECVSAFVRVAEAVRSCSGSCSFLAILECPQLRCFQAPVKSTPYEVAVESLLSASLRYIMGCRN